MAEFDIVIVAPRDPVLGRLDALIDEMYEYMSRHGLQVPLVERGATKLRRSMESSLGRTGQLVLARQGEAIAGFAHGSVRLLPDYLGGHLVGFVGHTYVREQHRGAGLGALMFAALQTWFESKGARSIELQVLTANHGGIGFWESQGFGPELLQMRKPLVVKER